MLRNVDYVSKTIKYDKKKVYIFNNNSFYYKKFFKK